jgi:hypothetical protein
LIEKMSKESFQNRLVEIIRECKRPGGGSVRSERSPVSRAQSVISSETDGAQVFKMCDTDERERKKKIVSEGTALQGEG